MNDLNSFLDNLQEQIFDEARQALGEKGFDRWRNPKFNKKIDAPDTCAMVTGDCGDSMEICLKFKDNIVSQASYSTSGCASSQICGSFAAELAIGKTVEELFDINGQSILEMVGRLPESDMHCATLAAGTLQEALHHFMKKSLHPG